MRFMGRVAAMGAVAMIICGTGDMRARAQADAAQDAGAGLIALPADDGTVLDSLDAGLGITQERLSPLRRADSAQAEPEPRDRLSSLRPETARSTGHDGAWRAQGERAVARFALYVADPAAHDTLTLRTQSGINLLPERSEMRVRVNGSDVGVAPLTNFEGFAPADFALPDGVLRTGQNDVHIEFRQTHRIYCGPEATFELWTDLDLARSGVSVPSAAVAGEPNAAQFLAALAAQSTIHGDLTIRGSDMLQGTSVAWHGNLVALVNRLISGDPVSLSFEDYWSVAPPTPPRARITFLPAAEQRVSFRNGADGATVMVIETPATADPFDPLDQFASLLGALPDQNLPAVMPMQEVPFSEFGITTERFHERYAIRNYPFRLPSDWLVLTAAKARIHFDYIYSEGLPRNSSLLLRMNGEAIRLLPLRDEPGEYITRFPIDFEARLMRPGANMLTFEVMVPGDPADLPCALTQGPVLEIGDSSTLLVPYSPSMWIPDMGMTFASLTAESPRTNDLSARAFSREDVLTLSAAFVPIASGPTTGLLHLMSFEGMGAVPTGDYEIDRRLLENHVLAPQIDIETISGSFGESQATDPFVQRTRSDRAGVQSLFSRGWQFLERQAGEWVQRVVPTTGDRLNTWLETQQGQAVLIQLDENRSNEIWMLRNPNSDIHAIASAMRAARLDGDGPRGQISVLGYDGKWNNWTAPDRRPVMLEPLGFDNMRYALGNVVSARPIFYTGLLMVMALVSAVVGLRLVISTREHNT